jgi:hypothetical protein
MLTSPTISYALLGHPKNSIIFIHFLYSSMKKDPNVKYHCDKACPNYMNIQCIRCSTVLSALLNFLLYSSIANINIHY